MMAQHPLVSNYNLSSLRRIVVGAAPVASWTFEKVIERVRNPDLMAKQGRILSLMLTGVASMK